MHRLILLPVLLVPMLIFSFQCHKNDARAPIIATDPPWGVLIGKLVVNAACSHYVIQMLTPIDSSKVVASWKDPQTNNVYTNVFTVANVCTFDSKLQRGDTIGFQLDEPVPVQDCAVCLIYYPTPPKSNAIKNVQKYH